MIEHLFVDVFVDGGTHLPDWKRLIANFEIFVVKECRHGILQKGLTLMFRKNGQLGRTRQRTRDSRSHHSCLAKTRRVEIG